MADGDDVQAFRALGELYHAAITGLVLAVNTQATSALAEELVFRIFRRQQEARFLPGLAKLGLLDEPHAVACAKYHYLSNQLGGVRVEYLEESPKKAWVRYPPPRWIWAGTAICAIPSAVNLAMLRAWHANNGVLLNNPRLGFVCTGTTVDGQAGLEGYYLDYERDLAPEERLRHAPGETCPPIDPGALPRLERADWPEARKARAWRNYAMAYLRTALPVLVELLGADEARRIGGLALRQIGMQHAPRVAGLLGAEASAFEPLLARLIAAHGDVCAPDRDGRLVQHGWKFGAGLDEDVFECWVELWRGLLAATDRFAALAAERTQDGIVWTISPRSRPPGAQASL